MVTEESDQEIHTDRAEAAPRLYKYKQLKLRIPSINARLIHLPTPTPPRLLDFLRARPSRDWLNHFRLSSPLAVFRRTVNRKEEISLSVPSPGGPLRRIRFLRKIDWSAVLNVCRHWLLQPLNIALLIWLLSILVVAVFLGLLLLGALNRTIRSKQARNDWIEICNQIINALFTLMSLYQHPVVLHHLFMLLRWRPEDIVALRKVYCKDGAYRAREWLHMTVVAILIQIAFLAQYALCAVYWAYPSATRPEYLEDVFGGVGLVAPVVAGVYALYSPLGREFSDSGLGEESRDAPVVAASEPEWVGGLFDCRDDTTVAGLSFFCTCCVFGWNMERLGFGNMYVHIVTFVLLCFAPFWIFSTTALKIDNVAVDDLMWVSGIVLCVLGLLYGGFWRTEMRKKFGLPGSTFCCGSASATDYFRWMFCWPCALAQEVRTGNFYDIEADVLRTKLLPINEEESQVASEKGSSLAIASEFEPELFVSIIADGASELDSGVTLIPPAQILIQSEEKRVNSSKISKSVMAD